MISTKCYAALLLVASSIAVIAQRPDLKPTTAAEAATRDTSYIDSSGTAHITRVVPIPRDLSSQAQHALAQAEPDQVPPESVEERRKRIDAWAIRTGEEWSKLCPNHIVSDKIAGVPVRIIIPDDMLAANRDLVLLNLHGGGFDADTGSLTETIPIAGFTHIKVVAVLYRLAPEHPFPAAVDDAVAVYRELLKTHKPDHIIIYGTSAGAVLTGEVAVKLKQLGLPMPAALGIFSGLADLSVNGDSIALFSGHGLAGHLDPPGPGLRDHVYIGTANPKDPVLSPIYADLRGLPPTLFITSERDMQLSGTINLHRAYLRADVDARLVVFDGLPHAFWYDPDLPESLEANHVMADFFVKHLRK